MVFGGKQRGVPKIVNGIFNSDFRLIMPYDRILICGLGASMIAAMLSVVTTLSRSVPVLEANLVRYGLMRKCTDARATNKPTPIPSADPTARMADLGLSGTPPAS